MNNINSVAIILARGGSKGIKNKNLQAINNKSLLEITVNQLRKQLKIDIFVSSDSKEILEKASILGCSLIDRPLELAGDESTSEEALLHSIEYIEDNYKADFKSIIFPQLTSPLRKFSDFSNALNKFHNEGLDSLFSSNDALDYLIWELNNQGILEEVNFQNNKRTLRQSKNLQIIENGSFYILDKELFKKNKVRLFGKIDHYKMESWQVFEIDSHEDLELCKDLSKIKLVDGIYNE